jgi:hypothetical protein
MKYIVVTETKTEIVEALDLTDLIYFQLTQEEQDNLLGILVYKEN